MASLNDKITVVDKSFVLDTEDRAKYGVDKAPATVVLGGGADTRMRFYGANTGYEFVSLVEAVLLAGTGTLELEPETLTALAAVDQADAHPGIQHAHLTALPQGGRPGPQDGVCQSSHHG